MSAERLQTPLEEPEFRRNCIPNVYSDFARNLQEDADAGVVKFYIMYSEMARNPRLLRCFASGGFNRYVAPSMNSVPRNPNPPPDDDSVNRRAGGGGEKKKEEGVSEWSWWPFMKKLAIGLAPSVILYTVVTVADRAWEGKPWERTLDLGKYVTIGISHSG